MKQLKKFSNKMTYITNKKNNRQLIHIGMAKSFFR